MRFEDGELVVRRGRAAPGQSSYLRGTARSAGVVAVAAVLCRALAWLVSPVDVGTAWVVGLWCIVIELLGASAGAAFATASDPNRDVSVGIIGGFTSHAALSAVVILRLEGPAEALVLALLLGAVAVGVGAAAGRAMALRSRRREAGV